MTFLKIGMFGLSTLGSFQLIRGITKDKIDLFFLPSLTIAIQVTILFFCWNLKSFTRSIRADISRRIDCINNEFVEEQRSKFCERLC